MEALRAYSPRVESVPLMAAGASPKVFLAWRPIAERAADARAGRIEALLLVRLAIQDHGRFGGVIREGTHAKIMTQFRMHKSLEPSAALGRSAAGRRGKASLFLRSVPGPAVLCFLMLFSASVPSFWDGDSMEYLR